MPPPFVPISTTALTHGSSRCAVWSWSLSGVLHVAAIGTLAYTSSLWMTPMWQALPTRDGHHSIELVAQLAAPQSAPSITVIEPLPDPEPPVERSIDDATEPLAPTSVADRQTPQRNESAAADRSMNPSDLPTESIDTAVGRAELAVTPPPVTRREPDAGNPKVADQGPPPLRSANSPRKTTPPANLPPVAAEPVPADANQPSQASQAQPASRRADGTEAEPVPRALFNPPPEYPAAALQARIEGRVVVRVSLTEAGKVATVAVQTSSGHAALDAAALAAVRKWRFEPTTDARGTAVRSRVLAVPVRFQIEQMP